jgi:hypothetical protein
MMPKVFVLQRSPSLVAHAYHVLTILSALLQDGLG